MAVKSELEKLDYQPINITLGEVLLCKEINESEKDILNQHLKTLGFEIID
jgi:hypothetical protein